MYARLSAPPLVLAVPTVLKQHAGINGKASDNDGWKMLLARAPGGRALNSPWPCAAMRSQQRRAATLKICFAGGCALGVRGLPVVLAKPAYASQSWLIKRKLKTKYNRKYAALATVLRQGSVHLGVCTGRGLSTARGTAEAEASEMSVYLGTR